MWGGAVCFLDRFALHFCVSVGIYSGRFNLGVPKELRNQGQGNTILVVEGAFLMAESDTTGAVLSEFLYTP